MAAGRAGLADERDADGRRQRWRHVVGPSDVFLDAAATVLSIRVRAERIGEFARASDRPISSAPHGEPPRHQAGHRRGGHPDLDIDGRGDIRALRARASGPLGPARVARFRRGSRPSPHRFGSVDLWQPEPDGPCAAVAVHGARRGGPRPPGRDPEGRPVVTLASPRSPPEGTRAGDRAPIQPAHARERHPVCSDAAAAGQAARRPARPQDSTCDSSRAICLSWATPGPASLR